MFGFGKKNKKGEEKTKQELEFITMESALSNVSPEEIFDKSIAKKTEEAPKETRENFELPKKQITNQIKDQRKDQAKQLGRKRKNEGKGFSFLKKREPQTKNDQNNPGKLFEESAINAREVKARKIEVPLENNQAEHRMLIDEILKRKEEKSIKKQIEKAEEQLPLNAALMPQQNTADASQILNMKRNKELEETEKEIKKQSEELKKEETKKEKKSKIKPIIKRLLEEIQEKPEQKKPLPKTKHINVASPFGIGDVNKMIREEDSQATPTLDKIIQTQTRPQPQEARQEQPIEIKPEIKPETTPAPQPIQREKRRKLENRSSIQQSQVPDSPFFAKNKEEKPQNNSLLSSELGERENNGKEERERIAQPQMQAGHQMPQKNNNADLAAGTLSKTTQQAPRTNRLLFYFAIIVLLLTLSGGLYYYFFVIKNSQTGWVPIDLPSALDTKTQDPAPAQTTKNDLKKELSGASSRSISQANFQEELKQLLTALKSDSQMEEKLENGAYFNFVSESGTPYTPKQLLALLAIESESVQSVSAENGWAFLVLEERNTLTEELKTIKFNLLFELTAEKQNSQIVAAIMDEEEELPRQFLPLFIDEQKPTVPIFVKFERSFTQSEAAPQTRFFNYNDANGSKSIDWGVVTSEGTNYLIISTSENSTQQFIKSLQ